MPRKVNIELTYKLKLEDAERKHKDSLAAVEAEHKKRLEKIEAWKQRETALEQDIQNRAPRISKEAKELQEAKERQKQMLEEGKKKLEERKNVALNGGIPEPTNREKERASVFDFFASLQEDSEQESASEESEDEWDLSDMSEDGKRRYLKSRQKDGAEIPSHLLHLLEEPKGEKISEISPQPKESEKPEPPAELPKPPILFQKSEEGGKNSEKIPPNAPLPLEEEEPPKIISNTKIKKPVKRVPWKQND